MTDTSPSKYLNIQKLCAAYAPKKNENKNNALLLPRVSNTSLTKDNLKSCTPSPRKQELEDVPVSPSLSSPRKLINSDDDKVKKIYLSEAHSGMITGIPCAPPSTPTVGMWSVAIDPRYLLDGSQFSLFHILLVSLCSLAKLNTLLQFCFNIKALIDKTLTESLSIPS